MNQQRAIGTLTGQRQAVLIARSFLMSWYAFSSEEHALNPSMPCFTVFLSTSMPFSAVFYRILPCFAASVLCPSAMVRLTAQSGQEECNGLQERKLAILACAGERMQNAIAHEPKAGHLANFSGFDQLFRALLSFPFRFGGQPKRYMSSMQAALACSTARHRQIPDEKHVGFPPCARRSSQAHLAQATRSARLRRYLIPELAALSTTNVNFAITSVVALYRRLDYTFLIELHAGEDQLEQPGPEEIRFQLEQAGDIGTPVLDFPGRESYSFQKQKTRLVVW